MPRPLVPSVAAAPLLVWHELHAIDAVRAERMALRTKIGGLPRHSHRRLILESRLADLTARQLELELSAMQAVASPKRGMA